MLGIALLLHVEGAITHPGALANRLTLRYPSDPNSEKELRVRYRLRTSRVIDRGAQVDGIKRVITVDHYQHHTVVLSFQMTIATTMCKCWWLSGGAGRIAAGNCQYCRSNNVDIGD
jgi:hypothetical protein